jgi:hypothetical protein
MMEKTADSETKRTSASNGSESPDGTAGDSGRFASYLQSVAQISGLITGLAATIYILGLATLWLSIHVNYDTSLHTAWYAASEVPRTVVAGHGAKSLIWPALVTALPIAILIFMGLSTITLLLKVATRVKDSSPKSSINFAVKGRPSECAAFFALVYGVLGAAVLSAAALMDFILRALSIVGTTGPFGEQASRRMVPLAGLAFALCGLLGLVACWFAIREWHYRNTKRNFLSGLRSFIVSPRLPQYAFFAALPLFLLMYILRTPLTYAVYDGLYAVYDGLGFLVMNVALPFFIVSCLLYPVVRSYPYAVQAAQALRQNKFKALKPRVSFGDFFIRLPLYAFFIFLVLGCLFFILNERAPEISLSLYSAFIVSSVGLLASCSLAVIHMVRERQNVSFHRSLNLQEESKDNIVPTLTYVVAFYLVFLLLWVAIYFWWNVIIAKLILPRVLIELIDAAKVTGYVPLLQVEVPLDVLLQEVRNSSNPLVMLFLVFSVIGGVVSGTYLYRKSVAARKHFFENTEIQSSVWKAVLKGLRSSLLLKLSRKQAVLGFGMAYGFSLLAAACFLTLVEPPLPHVEVWVAANGSSPLRAPDVVRSEQHPSLQESNFRVIEGELVAHTESYWYIFDEERRDLLIFQDRDDSLIKVRED